MSRFPQKKTTRGSQRWIQFLVNERPDLLNKTIGLGNIRWLSPVMSDQFAEYRDKAFIDLLGICLKKRPLSDFWPKGGPQWDALGISESGEAILVEAKAHIQEIFSPPSGASPQSLPLIIKSLSETASAFQAKPGLNWHLRFYQYANRLAHVFLLKELNNIPARLIFLYFTGDTDMNGPETVQEWQAGIEVLHEALGIRGRVPTYVSDVFIDVNSNIVNCSHLLDGIH
jgi:hypothetical protein